LEVLDRSKITPNSVRKELSRSNLSNIAIARECKLSLSKIRDFRKGVDGELSKLDLIKIHTLVKKGTF